MLSLAPARPRWHLRLPARRSHHQRDRRRPGGAGVALTARRCSLYAAGRVRRLALSAGQAPSAVREIGRLREITFRQIGEGTGAACDLDRFDRDYTHLALWHRERRQIAGSYRLGNVAHAVESSARAGCTPRLFSAISLRFSTHRRGAGTGSFLCPA